MGGGGGGGGRVWVDLPSDKNGKFETPPKVSKKRGFHNVNDDHGSLHHAKHASI